MKNIPQWINWRLVPDPPRKPKKVPTDLATGQRIDPHNPTVWLSHAEAVKRDPVHIGFVLTDADPYWCVDLDHCRDGHTWSSLAVAVCTMFPGAYVEISYSGDGLHIIGQGSSPAGYGTRGPGVELYTRLRFIAITGQGAQGDPDTQHDLTALASLYLKPAEQATPADWTTAPVAGSNPIADDDELIRKMLTARQSAGVAFGGKASASDLWTRNVTAIADAFPSSDPTKPYDGSAADAALAAHLAFWTGKDCSRIERLMRRSSLVREKWDRRGDDYLKRTIVGAVGRVQRVYDVGLTQQGAPEGIAATSWPYLTIEAQQTYFAGCVHIIKGRRALTPRGILTPDEFNDVYGKKEFQIAPDSARPVKNAWEAFTRNRAIVFPWADTTCFRPELPPAALVEENGRVLVNTYQERPVKIGNGDASPFVNHVAKMLPDDNDRTILLSYLAAIVQHKGTKFQWAPLIQGTEGNGKGIILKSMEYAVGDCYTHKPSAKELGDSGSKFTGWIANKLLIVVDEIYVSDRRDLADALKPLITDDRVEIQAKGQDQITGDNRANFILTSNHKDAIVKTANDRRYCVLFTAQQSEEDCRRDGMSGDYFPDLWAWLRAGGYADVAGYLSRFQIPDALNPATRCHRAPRTSSTDAAIAESRGVVEQSILEACEEGRQGFAGGWISSVRLAELLNEIRRNVGPRKRGDLLTSIGYVKHPALTNGQVSAPLFGEGMKRPYLYVREGSINYHNLHNEQDVINAYVKAQGYAVAHLHKL